LENWSIPQDVLDARAYDAGYRNAIAPHGSLPIDYRENGDWSIFAPAEPLTAEQLDNLARLQQFGGDPNYNKQYVEQKAQELDDWRHDPNRNRDMLIGGLMVGSLLLLLGGGALVAAGSLGFLSGAAAAVSSAAGAVVSTVSGLISSAGSFINNIGSMIIPPVVNANGTISRIVVSSEAVAKAIVTAITGVVAVSGTLAAMSGSSGGKPADPAKTYPKQYEQYKNLSDKSLEKAIQSHEKNIVEHEAKISEPESYVKNWDELTKEHQNNLLHHWQEDINRHQAYKDIAKKVLESRK
jgi:hypothetical protein